MDCCERTIYDDQFDEARARDRLRAYRREGPPGWTRRLIEGLAAGDVTGLTVLEIGGGVGAIHLALLDAGAASAVDVDASGPYLVAAREEAERRGYVDRITHHKGDAVALGGRLEPADLVALDRVVCCYPDMLALVSLAASRTRRRLGIVIPRDDAWIRAGVALSNAWSAIRRDAFRVHVHRTAQVLETARANGLVLVEHHRGWFWQTLVLERALTAD